MLAALGSICDAGGCHHDAGALLMLKGAIMV
jgi:hypothetical protein